MSNYSTDVLGISNLVAYWRCTDASGTTITDFGPNSLNGTSASSTSVALGSTSLVTGSTDTSALFDGTANAQVDLGTAAETFFHNWDRTQPWTIEVIIEPNVLRSGSSTTYTIWSKMNSSSPFTGVALELEWNDPNAANITILNFFMISNFGSSQYIRWFYNQDLSNGNIYHIVVSYSGGGNVASFNVTINGSAISLTNLQDTLGSNSIVNSIHPSIGSRNLSVNQFKGNIQELAIYSVAVGAQRSTLVGADVLHSGKIGRAHV